MRREATDSYDELVNLLNNKTGIKKTIILFTGSKDDKGKSWCPDCVVAEPMITQCLATYEEEDRDAASTTLFITVTVGDRDTWKSAENAFRTGKFGLKCIPTLLKYGTTMRLQEKQLVDDEMVSMLLEE